MTFTAFYPYNSAGYSNIQVNADQSTQARYTASDFMAAQVASAPADGKVNLVFDHKLSKLVIVLDNQTAEEIADVFVGGVKGRATYDNGNITPTGEEGLIKTCPVQFNNKPARVLVIVPQKANPVLMITTKSGKQYTYKTEQAIDFRSGTRRVAEVLINEDSIFTDFTGDVNNWTDDNDIAFGQGGTHELEGSGTLEDPYTAADMFAIVSGMPADEVSAESYYFKGIISSVKTTFEASGTYGNASFYIVDKESDETSFYVYQTYYLGNRKWQAGDTDVKDGDAVIVYGPVVNFRGTTPETAGKGASYIYSLNGVTDPGDTPQPQDAKAVSIAEFIAAAESDSQKYQLTGSIGGNINTTYGNFDLTDDSGTVYVYGLTATELGYGAKNDKSFASLNLAEGDIITLIGYRGSYNEKIEVMYAYFVSKDGSVEPGELEGSGTVEDPFTVADAFEITKDLTWTSNTEFDSTEPYYVKGIVSKVQSQYSATYGNAIFYISADGSQEGQQFEAYQILYLEGKTWVEGMGQIAVGDDVVLYGPLMNYRGTQPETVAKQGYVYSINGVTEAGEGPEPEETLVVSIAEFNAAEESQTQTYQLTGAISNLTSTVYGNFDLVDETGSVYVYGLTATELGYGAKNDKSFESLGLAEGDIITIIGYRGSYNEKIEVTYAYFVSKEGSGPGPEPEEPIVATIADFNEAAESDSQQYQLTGKISNLANTTYGNFDLVDETGSVYVYGLTATDLGYGAKNDKSFESLALVEGDIITIIGYRGSYNGKIEVMYAYFVEKVGHDDNPGDDPGDDPEPEVISATIAEFNAAEESDTQKYELTGTIKNLTSTTYGNFDLVDETGSVYVYGLTATELGYGAKNDKSFASLNVGENDIITLIGYRGSYNDKIEVLYAYFVVHQGHEDNPGDDPGDNPGGEDDGTTVSFTKDQLAAAPCKNAEVKMNDVVSFTNSSDYNGANVTELRIYKSQVFTVMAADGYKITGIEFTCTASGTTKQGPGCWGTGAPAGYSFEDKTGTWTGSESTVVFTAVDNQVRIDSLKVSYAEE